MEELKSYASKVPDKMIRFVNDRPMWQKITLGSSVLGYLYIRYKADIVPCLTVSVFHYSSYDY